MAKTSAEVIEKDMGWKRIQSEVKRFKNSYTAVGYFSGASDKLAMRAFINENGARIKVTPKMKGYWLYNFGVMLKKPFINIPARPFMKQTFEKNKDKIRPVFEKELSFIFEGKSDAKASLSRIGEWYTKKIKRVFIEGTFAPNSSFTKSRKKSSRPLIDSSEMRNRVVHKEFIK